MLRYISSDQIPEPIDMAVMDLWFISTKLVLSGCVLAAQGRRRACVPYQAAV